MALSSVDNRPASLLNVVAPHMFGDAYIRLRAQVGTALYSLVRLAQECDAPAETVTELEELRATLDDPFRFVALGEAEAGKSSLLNALFGRDFTDAPERTQKITVYRHGAESHDEEFESGVVERRRPFLFLRDFQVVDTPAIALRAEIVPPLASYVASADLLLFVFAASRPEADRTWTLMTRLNAAQLQRVVCVADISGGETPEDAIKNVRQLMMRRLGKPRPIFAIDTRRALAARIVGDRTSLAASGIARLEQYIDREVADGLSRRAPLDLARVRGREILKEITGHARQAVQTSSRDGKLLRDMHGMIEQRKEQALRQIGGILWSLSRALEDAQQRGESAFQTHLTLFGLLRAPGRWRADVQRSVEDRLRETVLREIEPGLRDIEADRRVLWEDLERERRRTISASDTPQPPDFPEVRQRLSEEIAAALDRHVLDPGTDQHLGRQLSLASMSVRVCMYALALSVAGAAWTAVAHPGFVRPVLIGLALLAVATGVALLFWQARLRRDFRQFSTARREALVRDVDEQLRLSVDHFAEDLADSLGPIELACLARRKTHEPIAARAQQLDGVLAKAKAEPDAPPRRAEAELTAN